MQSMPGIFLAHAAPTFAVEQNATTAFWDSLPKLLPQQPKAVLCVSGHWETMLPTLSDSQAIQHDFYGFPDELYQLDWKLPTEPSTTAWLQNELAQRGVDVMREARPLDHGVWVPLRQAWPEPAFPVYQLSICPANGTRWHVELGEKLASLREEGIAIIGTGGLVHNLGRIDWHAGENEASDWANRFMQATDTAIANHDLDALCDPWSLPHGNEAVPSLDHYLPLLVILGMAGNMPMHRLHAGWHFGTLAMHSYGFDLEVTS